MCNYKNISPSAQQQINQFNNKLNFKVIVANTMFVKYLQLYIKYVVFDLFEFQRVPIYDLENLQTQPRRFDPCHLFPMRYEAYSESIDQSTYSNPDYPR